MGKGSISAVGLSSLPAATPASLVSLVSQVVMLVEGSGCPSCSLTAQAVVQKDRSPWGVAGKQAFSPAAVLAIRSALFWQLNGKNIYPGVWLALGGS